MTDPTLPSDTTRRLLRRAWDAFVGFFGLNRCDPGLLPREETPAERERRRRTERRIRQAFPRGLDSRRRGA